MKYRDPKPSWATELAVVFVMGFLLASAVWLGAWFLYARPVQAAQQSETESALAACQTARDTFELHLQEARAASQQTEVKLRDAMLGWGRCIRGKAEGEKPAAEVPRTAKQ
jgi:hypothetical protein